MELFISDLNSPVATEIKNSINTIIKLKNQALYENV